MEASNDNTRPDRPRRFSTLTVGATIAIIAPLAGCASPPDTSTALADWCWTHYNFAPSSALALDDGPDTHEDAVRWSLWLEAGSPAPDSRDDAHSRQLELVQRFRAEGEWSEHERDEYVDAALSDPTPATVCETAGARIIPAPDGALPEAWERRFVDPADPARSNAARAEADGS